MMVNAHWGGVTENNHFGTHEFLEFCELINTEPYICGNVGSGTVQEMREWVEYLTFDGKSPMADWRRENGKDEPWKIKYFGVGNENWGCGGNMRPEYYADLYRRYSSYVRNFSGNKIFKIAGGAPGDNYYWTEVLMREACQFMDGISLHHYVVAGPDWDHKGSSVEFSENGWFEAMKKTWFIEELVTKHSIVMDKYDPQKRVALMVDEWGMWHDVLPGTNPGFLYQQNTLRDALVAGVILNIFNNHCDRIRMANIAQLVNVLQALILTEGEKMILTPTFHVFDMYKIHQDAELLAIDYKNVDYTYNGEKIPQISTSASVDSNDRVHITICNLNHKEDISVNLEIRGQLLKDIKGSVLTNSKINAHNTFDEPEAIKPDKLQGISIDGNAVSLKIPAKSIVLLEIN